jgi:hypothetical protein
MKLGTYVKGRLMYPGCSKSSHAVEMLVNNCTRIFGEVQSCSVRFGMPKVIRTCKRFFEAAFTWYIAVSGEKFTSLVVAKNMHPRYHHVTLS